MEKEIKIFENPQFGKIRTMGTSEEPLFCASDVCKALGYSNGRKAVADHADEGDVTKCYTPMKNQFGAVVQQLVTYVNESGLYALIFGSKLESAKDFKRWVTSEVLPSIRKHGAYMTNDVIERTLTDPDFLIKLATELKNEKQARMLAEHKVEQQSKQLTEQQPKIEFYNTVVKSNDTVDMEESAKILNFPNVGRNKLFDIMREMKVFFGTKARPYQKYIDNGCFKLVEYKYIQNDQIKIGWKVVVFQKGLDFMRCVVKQYLEEQKQKNNDGQMTLF